MKAYVSVSLATAMRAAVLVAGDGRQIIAVRDVNDLRVVLHVPGFGAEAAAFARVLGYSLVEAAEKVTLADALAQRQVTPAEAAIVATLIGPQEPGRAASPSGDPQS